MARQPRCAAAGRLHLLELRWCADVAARLGDAERLLQARLLAGAIPRWGVVVHAYSLGRTRTLLLLTPATGEAVSRLVQDLCRRLAAQLRHSWGRTGPLLVGRFRSTILEPGPHLLDAMTYVEQLSLREDEPLATPGCSSAEAHCGGARNALISDHPDYWRTGNTPFEREVRHRERLAEALNEKSVMQFDAALSGGWPLGGEAFLQEVAQQLHRRLVPRSPGRPRKSDGASGE